MIPGEVDFLQNKQPQPTGGWRQMEDVPVKTHRNDSFAASGIFSGCSVFKVQKSGEREIPLLNQF
jgi:hypothetical protein